MIRRVVLTYLSRQYSPAPLPGGAVTRRFISPLADVSIQQAPVRSLYKTAYLLGVWKTWWKAEIFSLPMLIPFIDCKIHKRCPRLGMCTLFSYTQCKWKFDNAAHNYRCRKWPKSETNFRKECIKNRGGGGEERQLCHQNNHTHENVHSSAIYYQNLNVVR